MQGNRTSGLYDGVVVATTTASARTFVFDLRARKPGSFVARTTLAELASVPTWPASHGRVRVPLSIAAPLRERRGRGSVIRVYA